MSKLATEAYALSHAACFGLGALAFRFFNVFGPLQAAGHAYAAVVPAFVVGRPRRRAGHRARRRRADPRLHLRRLGVRGDRRRGAGPVASDRPVNLAFGGRSSLLELLAALEAILGHPIERVHTEPRAGDVRDSQADQTNLRALFPSTTPVDLDEGLRRTVAWFETGSRGVKVLVTGAAGFIGSQLAEALAAGGRRGGRRRRPHRLLRRRHQAGQRGVRAPPPACEFVEADLRYSDLRPLLDGVEVVYHQAAQPGVRASWDERFADYATHNVLGTQRLLEAARHAGRAPLRVRVVELDLRQRHELPDPRGDDAGAVQPLRRHQAGRRAPLQGLRAELRRSPP